MGSVHNLLRAYGVGSKQFEAHKQNQNPDERRIQEIKGITRNVLDCSGKPIWSWILCISYVVSIINCMAHRYLSYNKPHKAAYGFTPDVPHLMEFELWDPILILDDKTQYPNPREIFGYYAGPDPNKGALGCSWVCTEEHGLLASSVLNQTKIPIDPKCWMVPVSGKIN